MGRNHENDFFLCPKKLNNTQVISRSRAKTRFHFFDSVQQFESHRLVQWGKSCWEARMTQLGKSYHCGVSGRYPPRPTCTRGGGSRTSSRVRGGGGGLQPDKFNSFQNFPNSSPQNSKSTFFSILIVFPTLELGGVPPYC